VLDGVSGGRVEVEVEPRQVDNACYPKATYYISIDGIMLRYLCDPPRRIYSKF
jgi:hypothetical protein